MSTNLVLVGHLDFPLVVADLLPTMSLPLCENNERGCVSYVNFLFKQLIAFILKSGVISKNVCLLQIAVTIFEEKISMMIWNFVTGVI